MNAHDEWLGAIDWEALRAPFPPEAVEFRIQSTFERQGKPTAACVAYVDARAIATRLDEVCGPDGWAFDWVPVVDNGHIVAAKGTLTIAGIAKSDVGDAGDTEPTKARVSDALKRTAVLWGVGRYLYEIPVLFATFEERGRSKVLPEAEVARLRAQLGRRSSSREGASTDHATAHTTAGRSATRTASMATTSAAASAPSGATDDVATNVTDFDLKVASDLQQMDLARTFKAAGFDTTAAVEAFVAEHANGRAIDALKLKGGTTAITIREVRALIRALAAHNQRRAASAAAEGE